MPISSPIRRPDAAARGRVTVATVFAAAQEPRALLWSLVLLALTLLCLLLPARLEAQPVFEGPETRVNEATFEAQSTATAAVADDGSFVVVFESYYHDGEGYGIFLRRFDSTGSPVGGDLQVNATTTFDQVDPDVALLADGSFVVVWDAEAAADGSLRGIFGQLIDAAGAKIGTEFPVNGETLGDQNDAVVAPTLDGGFVVVWEHVDLGSEFEDLFARRFAFDGTPVGDEMQVNVFTPDDQEDADIAAQPDGNFVVVWESEDQDGDYDSIVHRRLDSTGTPFGDEMIVNTYVPGDQANPDVAAASDGSFTVVWEDDTQGGFFDPRIYARRFLSDGTPAATPFQVESAIGYQFGPRVAYDTNDNAVVVWFGDGLLDDPPGVFLKAFDADGATVVEEMLVNTYTTDWQYDPHVAFGANGQGLVVWTSDFQDSSYWGIYSQRLNTPIFADGFESGDTTEWTSQQPGL